MNVLVTGATGFIGRALVLRLLGEGHRPVAWVRSLGAARAVLGSEVRLVDARAGAPALAEALAGCEGAINLAGEPLVPGRWTRQRKGRLVASRVETTRLLVEALEGLPRRPTVLVSASAVGYYGDRGAEPLLETSAPGDDFPARLCQAWEEQARRAEALGVRVVTPRIAVVLGDGGGALAKMLLPFALGLGGPFGRGAQYMPWIHLRDLVSLLCRALVDPRWSGPVNAAAPEQVTNRQFARALARTLRRPAWLPVPSPALRLGLGEAATTLLASQRVEPRRLQELGFEFEFGTLEGALKDLLGPAEISIGPLGEGGPRPVERADYLARRRPQFVLEQTTPLGAAPSEVFPFFTGPENLGALTPPAMAFRIVEHPKGALQEGATISYRLRVAGVPLRWTTRIERLEAGRLMVDSQQRGPYRAWWHEHHFEPQGEGTRMVDRVFFAVPFGVLGRLAGRLFVAPSLRKIFRFRSQAIALRFGGRRGAQQPVAPAHIPEPPRSGVPIGP